METFSYKKEIPVSGVYDVLVFGGGPAGCVAAISAARMGARVRLIEQTGCLGGMSTGGLVTRLDTTSDGSRMIVGGVMEEIIRRLYDAGDISHYYSFDRFTKERGRYTPFDPEAMKRLLDDMCLRAGVEVSFFTHVLDASREEDRVTGAIASDVEGLRMLRAKAYVDATGDAILADACGFLCRRAGDADTPGIMPPTLGALVCDIPWDEIPMSDKSPALHGEKLKQALADGFFTQNDRLVPGVARGVGGMGGMNAGHVFGMDALDARALSDGMRKGRALVDEYARYYRKYVPGFERMRVASTGALMGVRESRRIVGEYTLTYEDYLARKKFPDQIALYCKSVDIHPYDTSGEEMERFRREARESRYSDGESYGIPYGVIVPKGARNLWVAGRCASSDRRVNSSMRVQPACAMLGQAAGAAAALYAGGNGEIVAVSKLQSELIRQGARLS